MHADVEALVHLVTFAAHAAKGAALPGFARGADEKLFSAILFEERAIGRGKLKWLGEGRGPCGNSKSQNPNSK